MAHGAQWIALTSREGIIAELEQRLRLESPVCLLHGPTGIGKTHLLDELCRRAERAGTTVQRFGQEYADEPGTNGQPASSKRGNGAYLLVVDRADRFDIADVEALLEQRRALMRTSAHVGIVFAMPTTDRHTLRRAVESRLSYGGLYDYRLPPLTRAETAEYLSQRQPLLAADGPSALAELAGSLHQRGRGVPALIENRIDDLLAEQQRGEEPKPGKRPAATRRRPVRAASALLVALAGASFTLAFLPPHLSRPESTGASEATAARPNPGHGADDSGRPVALMDLGFLDGWIAGLAPELPQPRRDKTQPASAATADDMAAAASGRCRLTDANIGGCPADRWTIQVVAAGDRDALPHYLREHDLTGRAAIVPTRRTGHRWFVVVTGNYPSRQAAEAAMRRLDPDIRERGAWARTFGSLQRIVVASR
ncbi:MAG: SPOR domain-containing protein [Ectothiorhodospiraceae bacterium]|jgi:septal ring-binding cell division protein DamX